ncbi:MAG: flippase [archaeon]
MNRTIDLKNKNYQLELEKHLTDTVKQSTIIFLGKIIGYILGFLLTLIIAKYFGSKIMGQYTLTKSILSFVSVFTVFGLNNGLVKYIPKYLSINELDKYKSVIKIIFLYCSIFSLIGSLIIFIFKGFIAINIFNDFELKNILFYASWLIIPLTYNKIFGGVYRGVKKTGYYETANQVLKRLLFIVSLLSLVLFDLKNTKFIFILFLISEISISIYLFIMSKKIGVNLRNIIFDFTIKKLNKSKIFLFSTKVLFINFMSTILTRADKIMLGLYLSSEIVGVYSIAAKLVIIIGFLHDSFKKIFSTIISELYSQDKLAMLGELYSSITKWIIIFSLPIVINMIIFSKSILNFFGEEYLTGATSLIILSIGYTIKVFVGSNGYILKMSNHENLVLYNDIVMVITNIFLNILLIPKLGILGAALATSIAISVLNIVKLIQVKYYLNIFPYSKNYYHICINLILVTIFSLLTKMFFENFIVFLICTSISILFSFGISYFFRDDLDRFLINKFKIKLRNLILEGD